MFTELLVALPLILLIALLPGLRRVPDGTVLTLHRRGHYLRTLQPGLRLTLPFFDRVGQQVPLVGHHLEFGIENRAQAELYFQILEPERTGAALDQVDAVVTQTARERLVGLVGGASDAETAGLCERLKTEMNTALSAIGVHVTRCRLRQV